MSKHEFKIGQSLIYRKGRTRVSGRYVVLAVLPQTLGEVYYRIRSQDDETLEYIACESELSAERKVEQLGTVEAPDQREA
jgi:hypothetical protein